MRALVQSERHDVLSIVDALLARQRDGEFTQTGLPERAAELLTVPL